MSEATNPGVDAASEDILLSSFFPGVSRSVAEHVVDVERIEPETQGENALAEYEGMGLSALVGTVIDLFQGALFLRCGRFFLEIRAAYGAQITDHGARYRCQITEFPTEPFEFLGNMLTIELPVRRR